MRENGTESRFRGHAYSLCISRAARHDSWQRSDSEVPWGFANRFRFGFRFVSFRFVSADGCQYSAGGRPRISADLGFSHSGGVESDPHLKGRVAQMFTCAKADSTTSDRHFDQ